MKFKNQLQKLMADLKLERKQFCSITGVPYGSLYDWLTTDKEPSDTRKGQIAEALGLAPDYFGALPQEPLENSKVQKAQNFTPKEASELMGVGIQFIYNGLQQGVFPWGYAVNRDGNWSYWINKNKFFSIEGFAPTTVG